jgi:hypothetical protein
MPSFTKVTILPSHRTECLCPAYDKRGQAIRLPPFPQHKGINIQ